MAASVLVKQDGPVLRVTLNRPEKLNAFSADLVDGLQEAVDKAIADGARLIVFTGEGKGFSGGFDLSGLEEMSDGDLLHRFVQVEQLLQSVYHAPAATMALVHGPCYGAAADLVAACQWRYGSPDVRFRMPGLRFGIVLGTQRLTNLVGAHAAQQLLLRDKPFGAEEAEAAGFLQGIAEQSDWSEREADILSRVTALGADTYAAMRAQMINDTRAADRSALLSSICNGSIKARIAAYLKELAAAKSANM